MRLILFLLLIHNLMAQPGPVQTTEQGVSNYSIQATDPTTTPVTGKKYLFNSNSQFKTKDSLNNYERVNKDYSNHVPNFDVEEGLTPFVYTAGTVTLNTATPMEGLRSLTFDATAINNFVETPLIAVPPYLFGNVCMVKVWIGGGDANLQLQVVNGAGTIIGQKQLAVYTDSVPQFITFNCPNQASVTATPNLGLLKIKIVQSTATNAALATLDSFYLGRFESNTMTVQEQPQWYYYTTDSDINGNFAFPAPTTSSGSGLFSYGAGILTALKPIKIDFNVNLSKGNAAFDKYTLVNCTISGIARQLTSSTGDSFNTYFMNQSTSALLNNGDVCTIGITGNGILGQQRYSITATPLPQLATIVNTNTPRAGWLGQRTWNNAACTWNRASTVMGAFPAVASCGTTVINSGFVVNDAITNGQLPKVTLSKLPKGKVKVSLNGNFNKGGANYSIFSTLALNGTIITPNNLNIMGAGVAAVQSWPNIIFTFDNPSDLINATIELYTRSDTGQGSIVDGNTVSPLTLVVSYEPDLSDAYSIPELYAALPPQVINSSGKIWRTETVYVGNNGTASFFDDGNWVTGVSRTGLGQVNININPNLFSTNPRCTATLVEVSLRGEIMVPSTTTSNVLVNTYDSAGNLADRGLFLTCNGLSK